MSGQALPMYGRRRDPTTANHRPPVPKAESFYLPFESLVAPDSQTKRPRKRNSHKKGDAFLITFDKNGAMAEPLNNNTTAGDMDQVSEKEGDEDNQMFSDYSYNLSRSSSRNTTALSDYERLPDSRRAVTSHNNAHKAQTSSSDLHAVNNKHEKRVGRGNKSSPNVSHPSDAFRHRNTTNPSAKNPSAEIAALNQVWALNESN